MGAGGDDSAQDALHLAADRRRTGHGNNAGVLRSRPAKSGWRSSMRRSIHGTLTATKRTVMAMALICADAHEGLAATSKSQSPHQKSTSPR